LPFLKITNSVYDKRTVKKNFLMLHFYYFYFLKLKNKVGRAYAKPSLAAHSGSSRRPTNLTCQYHVSSQVEQFDLL
jgi:hypothetical protein